jgi:hypothetical protein
MGKRILQSNLFRRECLRTSAMTIVFAFVASIGCHAQTFTSNGLKYTVTSATTPLTVAVSGLYDTSITSLNIPSTVTDGSTPYDVTSIANNAFRDNQGITSLTIPSSVTSIGGAAFHNCINLTAENLALPSGLTSIGAWAFNNCPKLKGSMTIPGGVTSIGDHAFNICTGLTSLTISDGVTSIGDYAFNGCSGLKGSLMIPSSVIYIGTYAFWGCTGFTGTLTISDGVKTIGDRAFQNTTFTGDLTIPNSVTSLGTIAAFCGCSKFNGNLTLSNQLTTIGTATFQGCSSLTGTLTIPNSVVTIGDDAFNSCKGITGNLTIPSSVTTIGNNAFKACSGFNGTLTISDGVKTFGGSAFLNCTSMVKATIPNSVTSIGGAAFCGCGKMLVCFNEGFNGAIGGAALQGVKGVWFTDKTPGFNPSATAGVDIGIGTTYYIPEDDAADNAQTDATSIKALYKAKISSTSGVVYRYYHLGLNTNSCNLAPTISSNYESSTAGASTLYVNFPAIVPKGLKAYYGSSLSTSNDEVNIQSINNTLSTTNPSVSNNVTSTVIPTRCAVVLLGDVVANDTVFEAATTSEPTAITNILTGSLTNTTVSSVTSGGGTVYTLGTGNEHGLVGFYQYTGTQLSAHKGYLLNTAAPSKNNRFIISIDENDDQATDISGVNTDTDAADHASYYNLQGIKVEKPTKGGIYIHNKKKIVIY